MHLLQQLLQTLDTSFRATAAIKIDFLQQLLQTLNTSFAATAAIKIHQLTVITDSFTSYLILSYLISYIYFISI
jgi:hypothetical protein